MVVLGLGQATLLPDISSLGESLNDLVSQPLDGLGYIPVREAAAMCENMARWRVEEELARLEQEGGEVAVEVGDDLQARCLSYVDYAGRQCVSRVNILVEELERSGRSLLSREQQVCSDQVTSLSLSLARSEEARLEQVGREEQDRLVLQYQQQGKQVESQVFADFEERGRRQERKIRAEFTARGAEEEARIRAELELRGKIQMTSIELELRKRGEQEAVNITKEFEERGAALEETIRKEFEERGDEIMKEVESELRARGVALQEEGETACAEMIVMACEVRPETEDQLGQYFSLF